MPFLRKFRNSNYSTPLILIVATLLSYGMFAAQQGFHWDDWGFQWMIRYGGDQRLLDYFSVARPVLARLFLVTLHLLGSSPLVWQVFALFWRAAAAVACWWALRQVFVVGPGGRVGGVLSPYRDQGAKQSPIREETASPLGIASADERRLAMTEQSIFWISLLTLLYPGFSDHSIAIAYGHYSLLFTAFWLSLGLMIVALRAEKQKWIPMAAALILSAWSLFSAEYAFGLELLRPVFLWFVFAGSETSVGTQHAVSLQQNIKRVIRAYLPYFLVLISFVIWRVFIFGFHMYQPELFDTTEAGAPLALSTLPSTVIQAIGTAAWSAWTTLLDFSAYQNFSARLFLVTLLILISSFVFLLFYDSRFIQASADREAREEKNISASIRVHPRPIAFIIIGLFGLLTAGIPFYVAGLPVQLAFPNDRFLMSFAFAAACLLVGLVSLIRKPEYRSVALALIVALSMGKQIQYADAFRQDWEQQQSFFWQLTWRAPQIEPHTALLSDDSAIRFSVDYSLVGPLNWTYNPDNPQGDVNYTYFFIGTRLRHELPDLKPNLPIQTNVPLAPFHGSTSDMLVFQFRPPACLHVLDPRYDSDLPAPPNSIDITKDMLADGVPVMTARTLQALPLSNVSRIVPDPERAATPPSSIFGTEPAHTWCFYFQKADLARQQGDWNRVAKLGDEAFAVPYYPNDASEFLPFIEADLRLGRFDDARDLTRTAYKQMPIIAPALCGVWQRVQADGAPIPDALMTKMSNELGACPVIQK